jgi:glutamine synthetase
MEYQWSAKSLREALSRRGTWIAYKREQEVDYVRLRPHPAEFELYYDI